MDRQTAECIGRNVFMARRRAGSSDPGGSICSSIASRMASESVIPSARATAAITAVSSLGKPNLANWKKRVSRAVWPARVIVEAASASSVNGNCTVAESPCGNLDFDRMAQYAVYWGNEEHHSARNPFYADYGSNNCTNFISQILRAGGGKFMRAYEHGDGSWWYYNFGSGGVMGDGPNAGWDDTDSWRQSDKLPRHLWRFGIAHIDPVQQPWGWTKGDIIAHDWIDTDGKGNINHLQFVVGTADLPTGREPLIANSSSNGSNYPRKRWQNVKERIELEHGSNWARFALAAKHRIANLKAKRHDPANLYPANGVFGG